MVQKDLANMNTAKCLHKLIGYSLRQLFCIGGYNATGYLNICETYHIKKNYWSYIAQMNEARGCPTTLLYGKLIYALGGTNEHKIPIEEYNVDTNIWTPIRIEDMNTWLHKGKGVGLCLDEAILLFESDGNLYRWNKAENKIVTHSVMKSQFLFVQTKPVIYCNYVYLFDNNEMQNQVVAYSISNQSWRPIPDWGKLCC